MDAPVKPLLPTCQFAKYLPWDNIQLATLQGWIWDVVELAGFLWAMLDGKIPEARQYICNT